MAAFTFDAGKLPTFSKHLAQPYPDRLYHYTTQRGVKGIVEAHEFWATKVQYMNDATEFRLGFRLVEKRIEHHLRQTTDEREKKVLSRLARSYDGIEGVNIFVGCFCENSDLLSQWRGYSGASHGYSIGMSSGKLAEWAERSEFRLARCIYDEASQIEIIDQLIHYAVANDDHGTIAGEFIGGLLSVSAFFKDKSFQEEQEWRIVSELKSSADDAFGFREGKSMLVPYYRIDIGGGVDSAIRSVTIGPCPHPKLAESSVRVMLGRHDIPGVLTGSLGLRMPEVHISNIPYRNW